jgi:hypothetical protein
MGAVSDMPTIIPKNQSWLVAGERTVPNVLKLPFRVELAVSG